MSGKTYYHGKSVFQQEWFQDPELSIWVKKASDPYSARCRFCPSALISLSSMGRQALISHMKGKKHLKAAAMAKSPNLGAFFRMEPQPSTSTKASIPGTSTEKMLVSPETTSNTLSMRPEPSPVTVESPQLPLGKHGIKRFLFNQQVTKAEIIWCIQSVMTHLSFRSASSAVKAMKAMFTDSDIAQKMELQRTKVGYLIGFGLAPYFKNELVNTISQTNCFVICFDESLNKVSQSQQMDILLKFWDHSKEEVSTRYLTSAFLQSSTAANLQAALIESLSSLDLKKILQVSMDGPNVNFKLLKDLKVYLYELKEEKTLIDFGSCSLHTVHNAFKTAIISTGWNLIKFLRALYNYFKDSPTRRGEFTRITNSAVFPKKFCAVRWVENADVAQRAIDILPDMKKYVSTIDKVKATSPLSLETIKECLKDPMIGPKLGFFKTLAADAEPFLSEFQSNWPYAPYLYTELNNLLRNVMKRFVKADEVKVGVDLGNEENLLSLKMVDLGFLTKSEIRKVKNCKDVDIWMLRKDAKRALKTFVKKLVERTPLKYSLTEHLTSLDPKVAISQEGQTLFDNLIEDFVNSGWISGTRGDLVSRQFKNILGNNEMKKVTAEFKRTKTRLDIFWLERVQNEEISEYKELKEFLQMVLILSHGNAHVERSFSINKECLIENLKEESLIGLRTVHDAVTAEGGLQGLSVTKSMIHSAQNASSRYKEALAKVKERKDFRLKQEDERKRKKKLLAELKIKKTKLVEDTNKESQKLDKQIEDLSKEL